jgi:hypothetical protein
MFTESKSESIQLLQGQYNRDYIQVTSDFRLRQMDINQMTG